MIFQNKCLKENKNNFHPNSVGFSCFCHCFYFVLILLAVAQSALLFVFAISAPSAGPSLL